MSIGLVIPAQLSADDDKFTGEGKLTIEKYVDADNEDNDVVWLGLSFELMVNGEPFNRTIHIEGEHLIKALRRFLKD